MVFEKLFSKKNMFDLKLRENSHDVMVDNCYKYWVELQVAAREVMTFFWGGGGISTSFLATSHDLRRSLAGEVAFSK